MKEIQPLSPGVSPFDAIRRLRLDGSEYWSARELMPLLGYAKWENFADAVEQARAVIEAEDGPEAAEREASRCREALGLTRQFGENVHLSRRASYLTAMRGDSRKPEIRTALIYFAVKAREAEVSVSATLTLKMLITGLADLYRAEHEDELAEAAHREHIVSGAARIMSLHGHGKPKKSMQAFLQLTIDIDLPGLLESDSAKELTKGDEDDDQIEGGA